MKRYMVMALAVLCCVPLLCLSAAATEMVMGDITPVPVMPVGYVTPYYMSLRSLNQAFQSKKEIVLYYPDLNVYLYVFFDGSCIFYDNYLLSGADAAYSVVFSDPSSLKVYYTSCDGYSAHGVETTSAPSISSTQHWLDYYSVREVMPYGATVYNDGTWAYGYVNSADVNGFTSFRLVSRYSATTNTDIGHFLPVAVSMGLGWKAYDIRYGSGAYYTTSTVASQVTLVDSQKNRTAYSLSLTLPVVNRYLTHFNYEPITYNQSAVQQKTDLGGISGSMSQWGSSAAQYQSNATAAVSGVTASVAAAQPVFTGIWNVLPPWVIALLSLSLAFVVGRKILGR